MRAVLVGKVSDSKERLADTIPACLKSVRSRSMRPLDSEVFQLEDISTALCQGRARGWPRLDERDGGPADTCLKLTVYQVDCISAGGRCTG